MLDKSPEPPPATRDPKTSRSRLPYLPGLDGLRALAVLAVLLYHADLRWIPGGFLGVEVFFVLSGYLITSLLLAEWHERRSVDLGRFWLRRARRLFPALFALVGVTLAFAVACLPDEVAGLRADALAGVGYVTNWYLILAQESYFEAMGRLSLLRHLWSLAVEAQFYLVWAFLLAIALRRWSPRRILRGVLVGAAASATLMAILYRPDADPSRVYFGSDTRAAGLLLGAALALLWAPAELQARASGAKPVILDLIGLGALGALVGSCLWVSEFQPFLYRGGFAVVALATAVAIATIVHPRARVLPAVLGKGLLCWVGRRSYSIYLWHWPVFMVTRPQLDLPVEGLPLLGLRLLATGILAEISYRCVENPVRNGALTRAWHVLREARGGRRLWLSAQWLGPISVLVVFCVVVAESVATAEPPEPPSFLSPEVLAATAQVSVPVALTLSPQVPVPATVSVTPAPAIGATGMPTAKRAADSLVSLSGLPDTASFARATPDWSAQGLASPTPPTPGRLTVDASTGLEALWSAHAVATALVEPIPTLTPEPTPVPVGPVTAIGDSVMLVARRELEQAIDDIEVDAEVGRQAYVAIQILRERRQAGELGAVVVLHLGSNGLFRAEQFDEMMQVLADVDRVIVVNLRVARRWQDPINAMLAERAKQYPNAELLDWYAASADRPELFRDDGVHMRPEGAQAYAALIAAQIVAP